MALKQQISALEAEIHHMAEGLNLNRQLLAGLQECLDVATQMNIALLLKLNGSAMLTLDDYKASAGRHLVREEVGDDIKLSVADAAGPTHTPAH